MAENCPFDHDGYCTNNDSCSYQVGDESEYCGIHEDTDKENSNG